MISNNTLREIAEELMKAERVLLYPHVNPDGDALGSSVSVCLALRKLGKKAYVLIEDDIAAYLRFIENGCCIKVEEDTEPPELFKRLFNGEIPDLCMCMDCGDVERFEKRREIFFAGKKKACIDHHGTSKPFADFNFIDGNIAAAAEISYKLIRELEAVSGMRLMDKTIGSAIYAGICTDTGNFQYSNTTKDSHKIVMELLDEGIEPSKISVELYQNVRLERILISSEAMKYLQVFAEGRAAMTFVTQKMLEETGASMDETEGIVETLRSIAGVEIGIFLKEYGPNETKVSTRAKLWADVAEICSKFGGGGHIRAAGCTIHEPIEKAERIMKAAVEEYLNK